MAPVLDKSLKPLAWLLGHWRTDKTVGRYPTTKDFSYSQELHFYHQGQPCIQFEFNSFHLENNSPWHREIGFIHVNPGTNQVSLSCAQNIGLVELEEGQVKGQELVLKSHNVAGMTFAPFTNVTEINRIFQLRGEELEQVVSMATEKTPLTEHLRTVYKQVEKNTEIPPIYSC